MRWKAIIFMICFCCHQAVELHAQDLDSVDEKPKASKMWNVDALLTQDFPLADMAKRFGNSNRIGFGLKRKTESNWIYGLKFEFIAGKNIKEDSLLYGLKTSQGAIIAQTGDLLNSGVFERGYMVGLQVGKIFPFAQINKNSGPLLLLSSGFMQHRIKLFDKDFAFPQLNGEYYKGYDRLTNGLYLEELIGYNYFSTNKLINCYAGINFVQGFTKGRRDFLYDVKRTDDAARKDFMWGFKLGWVIPFYRKRSEETYY